MSSAPVRAALRALADARAEREAASEALAMRRAEFERDHGALIAHVAALRTAEAEAEGAARAVIVQHYTVTKEKKPVPGAEVKLRKVMDYNEEAALAWARETKLCLVPESLDVRAFEKIAAATTLAFVQWREEPVANIAKHLNPLDLVEPPPTADPIVDMIVNAEPSPF